MSTDDLTAKMRDHAYWRKSKNTFGHKWKNLTADALASMLRKIESIKKTLKNDVTIRAGGLSFVGGKKRLKQFRKRLNSLIKLYRARKSLPRANETDECLVLASETRKEIQSILSDYKKVAPKKKKRPEKVRNKKPRFHQTFRRGTSTKGKARDKIKTIRPRSGPIKHIYDASDVRPVIDTPKNVTKVLWKLLDSGDSWHQIEEHFTRQWRRSSDGYQLERLKVFYEKNPNRIFVGLGEFEGYVVFEYKASDVVFLECAKMGNALYVMPNTKWREYSTYSKTRLLERGMPGVHRVIHGQYWRYKIESTLWVNGVE